MRTDSDVIVVGAGLAGLAAAKTARREGASVLVLEAHRPGGRARCTQRDGFTFNMGAHALYMAGPGARVLGSLGIPILGEPPPLARYRAQHRGTLEVLPTGIQSLLATRAVAPRGKLQLARLLAGLPRLDASRLRSMSVGSWLAERRLRPDAEALVRALIRLGTYTADTETFSAEAAVAQLQLAARGGVRYLHGGWDQLTGALSTGLELREHVEVSGVAPAAAGVEVRTDQGVLSARRAVLAPGGPDAVRRLLPADPAWSPLGPPVTAACLDIGVGRVPDPGYVLSMDEPLYATVQSPPARQAPEGAAVIAVLRYGARSAAEDRPQLEAHARLAGFDASDVRTERFLARMVVAGSMPTAAGGGFSGRPRPEDTGVPGVTMAGDWVGGAGLLADAALASGAAAGRLAARAAAGSSKLVA